MYFPISGVTIDPLYLILIGFLVGILGGFFGVGGGFLAGPILFYTGMPWNMVVGTDLAHMTGGSIVAARRHRRLGHVDIRLGLLMVTGTIVGIEIGAQIIELLKANGQVDTVVGWTYVVIGTDLFEVVISAGYGTLTHALKGNVDILIALVMQTGAAVGAQIGSASTSYFSGPRIRLLFSILPLIGALLVIARLVR
jgi:uncharacterized membrane protein YfcA